jgi:hypothetical protein
MLNLPLVPFEFFLFSMLLCYAAGMVSAMLLFLFVFERKPRKITERETTTTWTTLKMRVPRG